MLCIVADGSTGTTIVSDGSPTSSSAPSPTDHSKLSGSTGSTAGGGVSAGPGAARGQALGSDDDKRFPQPIGAGRTNKKPAGSSSTSSASQNIFQLGDPAANAGLWAFAAGEASCIINLWLISRRRSVSLIEHRIGGYPSYCFSQKMESQTTLLICLEKLKVR